MKPRIWTEEQLGKAVAVILNQVDGLWWAYYDIDLAFEVPSATRIADVLAAIEQTPSGHRWAGSPAEQRALLPVLLHVLDDQPATAREIFRRIFDVNEIPAHSGADEGMTGRLNRAEREHRERRYLADVRAGRCDDRPILVAEGDSWFQFPGITLLRLGRLRVHIEFVREIVDHLVASGRYCVRSIAAGGDWLSSMLRTRDYIEPLSRIEPDAFLFSGGGNDLLADGRVGNMVRHRRRLSEPDEFTRHVDDLVHRRCGHEAHVAIDRDRYTRGAKFLSKDFVSFMNLTLVQYFLFFSSLANSKLRTMAVVTQGYDHPIPVRRSTAPWYSLRRWINRAMQSGKWLWVPLEQKRLDEDEKRAVAYALITEFNELLVALAECGRFPRLYHVDLRGVARSERDWYDEIHLDSAAFARAAGVYQACLSDVLSPRPSGRKVFSAAHASRTSCTPRVAR